MSLVEAVALRAHCARLHHSAMPSLSRVRDRFLAPLATLGLEALY
jgi:hypothetical protein